MCGNFGLLLLGYKSDIGNSSHSVNTNVEVVNRVGNSERESVEYNVGSSAHSNNTSSHGVEPISDLFIEEGEAKPHLQGGSSNNLNEYKLLEPLEILRSQTARTEFRGGQAGGYFVVIVIVL